MKPSTLPLNLHGSEHSAAQLRNLMNFENVLSLWSFFSVYVPEQLNSREITLKSIQFK